MSAAPSRRPAADTATTPAGAGKVRVLKKYPNRRLYDTLTRGYITVSDVKQMVLSGEAFEVRDAKTGEDLTRSILLQIILDEEAGGMPMFSAQMLAQIIRFYGHTLQGMMGTYLEKNLQAFVDMQKQLADPAAMMDPKAFTPEAWAQYLSPQSPMMQGLMGNYLEQSTQMLAQMQEQMKKQAASFFPNIQPGGDDQPS